MPNIDVTRKCLKCYNSSVEQHAKNRQRNRLKNGTNSERESIWSGTDSVVEAGGGVDPGRNGGGGRLTRQEGRKDEGAVQCWSNTRSETGTPNFREKPVFSLSVWWEDLCALLNISALKSRELCL